ncbi:hypothetical protein BH11GEM1_BH11GEM1_31170 [soil metagenome]
MKIVSSDTGRTSSSADWRLVLFGLVVVSGYYVWSHLGGWIQFDDGALAQSAERLLQGQLPHRDFDEVYTGGLTWLNAGAFRLLGTNLLTLRLVLFAVFLGWVPAVYYIASRFVRPVAAAGVVLLAVVWSLPNYPAAMPSWYNLFLATFGVAAIFRHLEDGRRRWLVLSGFAGGLSVLVKVVGLYDIAGVLLFLVFHAHALSRATADTRRGRGYALFVSAALLAFLAALVALVRHQFHAPELVQFVLPGALVAALLVHGEWTQPSGTSRARFASLARLLGPFLLGVALPITLFLVPFARAGALGALANGVFILPMRRFDAAYVAAPSLSTMACLLPLALLAVWWQRAPGGIGRGWTVLIGIALAFVLIASRWNSTLYVGVWHAMRSLPPVLCAAGVIVLLRERAADTIAPLRRAQTLLLVAVTALCNLVQFPFSAPVYFSYVAPLFALVALALFGYMRPSHGAVPALLVVFFGGFAVFRTNSSPLHSLGVNYEAPFPLATLALERGGIEVPRVHAIVYHSLVPLLRARARGGYTWASPDAPEIYFLSGLRNPTRTLFDFFEDSTGRNDRVLRTLDAHGVTAIVLNTIPWFSPRITREMNARLAARYPNVQTLGPYQLRWRE